MATVAYLYFLGLNGIRAFRNRRLEVESDNQKFLVLIPAHNEDVVIKRAILSIRDTDYDQDLINIVVVADNCTDSTARIATDENVIVLDRHDNDKIGKGYAIEWALSKVDIENYDAVTVIDADNVIEKNYFKVIAGHLVNGEEVVQAYYGYFNVAKTPYSYILYFANLIENYLLYNSRSNLKLHTFLRGSGMTFKSSVLREIPWRSDSVTEDANYSIELIIHGKKVLFTAGTKVFEEALSYIDQSFNQRLRYNAGIISLIKNNFFRLFKAGILKADFSLIENALSFFLLSKPLLLSVSFSVLILGLLLNLSDIISIISIINIAAIGLYFSLGLFLKPSKGPMLKTFLVSPFYGAWLVGIYILSSLGYKKNVWVRTPRTPSTRKHPPIF